MKPTLVEAQSSSGYGKVPYTTSGPPISTNTGDIRKNDYKNMILEISNPLGAGASAEGPKARKCEYL